MPLAKLAMQVTFLFAVVFTAVVYVMERVQVTFFEIAEHRQSVGWWRESACISDGTIS
jgi:hypothetical protein